MHMASPLAFVALYMVASRFWWKSGQARAPTGGYYTAAVTAGSTTTTTTTTTLGRDGC
jgi:hypothetical protein